MVRTMDLGLLRKFDTVERTHWWWAGRRQLIKQVLSSHSPIKILDIGCGTGETLTYLSTHFPGTNLYGVDSQPSAVMFARKRGHKHIMLAQAERLPFKSQTFTTILFLDVIEHILDHKRVLLEAARVLKPGGIILITSPALHFIWSRHDSNQGHQRRYTRTIFKNLSQSLNLPILYMSYFNFLFSIPIILIRLLSKIRPLTSLANYDNNLNFDIVNHKKLNSFLQKCFIAEIFSLRYWHPPWGISIAVVLQKPAK